MTPEEMADLDGYEPSDFDRLSLHCTALEAEIDALQAENERFREFIRAFDDWRAGLMYPTPHPTENKAVAMIKARTALSESSR